MEGTRFADLVVGNTFERIPDKEATYDRSGKFKKIYRVSVYVDVVKGNPDIIRRIEADYGRTFPRPYTSKSRKEIRSHENGPPSRWRWFHYTHSVYGMFDIEFTITGSGGKTLKIPYRTKKTDQEKTFEFSEENEDVDVKFPTKPLPEDIGFQLEFDDDTEAISTESQSHFPRVSASFFSGDEGIKQLQNQKQNNDLCSTRVLIRVPDQEFTLYKIRKVCLNAIKYEDTIESLIWDHNHGKESNNDYLSNREAMSKRMSKTTNKDMHDRINARRNFDDLKECINPSSSLIYRFNLYQEEKVLEFCFGSVKAAKLEALVRFCVHFVYNSIEFDPPSNFKDERVVHYKLEFLFKLIRDEYVEHILSPVDPIMTDSLGDFDGMSISSLGTTYNPQNAFPMATSLVHPVKKDSVASFSKSESDDLSILARVATRDYQTTFAEETFESDCLDSGTRRKRQRTPLNIDDNMTIDCTNQSQRQLPTQSIQPDINPKTVEGFPNASSPQDYPAIIQSADDCQNETDKGLRRMLRILNAGIGNKKQKNVQKLHLYLNARGEEVSSHFDCAMSDNGQPTVAIEVVNVAQGQNRDDGDNDKICMYMPGGKKLERERTSVEKAKPEELSELSIEAKNLVDILSLLDLNVPSNHSDQIKELDDFIINKQVRRFAIVRVYKK